MDILKTSVDWAKAEVFSSMFFILFGLAFLLASVGFWQLGKTEMAKAYIIPCIVVGVLILTVGIGIFVANKGRITSFAKDYEENPTEFVQSEIARVDKSLGEYKNIVFKVIPFILVAAALLIFFIDKAGWRASCICVIGMMLVILLVDSNANARLQTYKKELLQVKE